MPSSRAAASRDSHGAAEPAPITRLQFLQDQARVALDNGQAALLAGRAREALRWLERAARIAPDDAGIALALASARIRAGQNQEAEAALTALAATNDLRELWLSLATVRRALGAAGPAATALHNALSRHALPDQPGIAAIADGIATDAGRPGWCALREDERLVVRLPGGGRATVSADGTEYPSSRFIPGAGVRSIRVTVQRGPARGQELIGSPISVAAIRRVEGIVWAEDGGLEGWAWHPANPGRDPVLSIHPAAQPGSAGSLTFHASDDAMLAPTPLSRPRRIHVPEAQLHGMAGPLDVTAADGRRLLGAPVDPGAERAAAASLAQGVARAFPAGRPANQKQGDTKRNGTQAALTHAALPAALRGPKAAAPARPDRPVAVVVPVYGNATLAGQCLAAVAATVTAGTRVIVVDDASPGSEITDLLKDYRRRPHWQVLRHPENRGFPTAANTGLRAAARLATPHDVVLLNSDAVVPPGWIETLRAAVHAAGDIGTATPLSNDATIASYPDPEGGNPPPADPGRISALAAAANPGTSVEIPTAIGFCMYLRHECLAQTGVFREDIFAQGYGEENDFCIRARHLGWRHVAVPSLLVAHIGGQSFGAARQQLITRNLAILERLHPGYHALIAAFQAEDPLADARRRIDMARWRAGRGRTAGAVLMITHDSGGGVERVVRARAAALRAEGRRAIVLRSVMARTGRGEYLHGQCRLDEIGPEPSSDFPNLRFRLPDELPALARLLRGDRIGHVELHHLLGHDHAVLRLAALLGVPLDTHLHDYALFCPRISLVGRDGRYCGEPDDAASCEACVRDLGRNTVEDIPIATLRARSAADLAASRRVVVPSADAASRLRRHFPAAAPVVEPLEDDLDLPPEQPIRARSPLRIAVIGGIGTEKGFDVLLACARNAAFRRLGLEFVVVGHTIDDDRLMETGHVFVTGAYKEQEAVALVRSQQARLAWLPSIWPETWCFTLGVAWRAGLRVAAFDIGAVAERIRRTGRGWLMPLGLAAPAVNTALLGYAQAIPSAARASPVGQRPAHDLAYQQFTSNL